MRKFNLIGRVFCSLLLIASLVSTQANALNVPAAARTVSATNFKIGLNVFVESRGAITSGFNAAYLRAGGQAASLNAVKQLLQQINSQILAGSLAIRSLDDIRALARSNRFASDTTSVGLWTYLETGQVADAAPTSSSQVATGSRTQSTTQRFQVERVSDNTARENLADTLDGLIEAEEGDGVSDSLQANATTLKNRLYGRNGSERSVRQQAAKVGQLVNLAEQSGEQFCTTGSESQQLSCQNAAVGAAIIHGLNMTKPGLRENEIPSEVLPRKVFSRQAPFNTAHYATLAHGLESLERAVLEDEASRVGRACVVRGHAGSGIN